MVRQGPVLAQPALAQGGGGVTTVSPTPQGETSPNDSPPPHPRPAPGDSALRPKPDCCTTTAL